MAKTICILEEGKGYNSIRWIVWDAKPFEKPTDPKDILASGTADNWTQASTRALKAVQSFETRTTKK